MHRDKAQKTANVVTLGEALIRYSPRGCQRLEQANAFDSYVAGAESNFAVACSRLSLKSAWISKLTCDPFGKRIELRIAQHGVDTTSVVWTDEHRVGKYYVELGKPPRPTCVYYDRAHSAFCSLQPDEVDWQKIRSATVFHTTGITPALSDTCQAVTLKALQEAHQAGVWVSFDINYRAKLWTADKAGNVLRELLSYVDCVIISKRDASSVFGQKGTDERILSWVLETFDPQIAVLTLGETGAIAGDGQKICRVNAFPTETVDPIGTGDAFAAGFVCGFLTTQDVQRALTYASAVAALKRTIPGDEALVSVQEVETLLSQHNNQIQR